MTALPNDYTRWLRAGALIWSVYFLLLMIAGRLHISKGTVRIHIRAIYRKLAVSDRTRAALIAISFGLAA